MSPGSSLCPVPFLTSELTALAQHRQGQVLEGSERESSNKYFKTTSLESLLFEKNEETLKGL